MLATDKTTLRSRSALPRLGRWRERLFTLGIYAVVLLAWQQLAPRVEPDLAPLRVLDIMRTFYLREEFLQSMLASIVRVALGFSIAAVLGIGVGTLLGTLPALDEAFDPIWSLLRPIAPLAWIPLVIVWFGVTETAAIFVIAFVVFFPIMLNTVQGIRQGARIYREAALTLGAGQRHLVWEVALPAALPSILTGLRVGMGLAWAVIVAAELVIGIVIGSGLGYLLIRYATITYSLSRVVAVVAVIGLLGVLSDQLLIRIADKLAPWRNAARARG